MDPEERSLAGFFMSFQFPIEILDVSNIDFLNMAYNVRRRKLGQPELGPFEDGFHFHHAEPKHLMMVYWNPETINTLLANANHRVGIGAFVMNENKEVCSAVNYFWTLNEEGDLSLVGPLFVVCHWKWVGTKLWMTS
ncbi:hypothetical protein U1Q18_020727 [Sarracenia purpurea var. burkii]